MIDSLLEMTGYEKVKLSDEGKVTLLEPKSPGIGKRGHGDIEDVYKRQLHAWIFTVFMYMLAALLASVAHYIYVRFIDHGYVINTCETMVDTLAQSNMPGMDSYLSLIHISNTC